MNYNPSLTEIKTREILDRDSTILNPHYDFATDGVDINSMIILECYFAIIDYAPKFKLLNDDEATVWLNDTTKMLSNAIWYNCGMEHWYSDLPVDRQLELYQGVSDTVKNTLIRMAKGHISFNEHFNKNTRVKMVTARQLLESLRSPEPTSEEL